MERIRGVPEASAGWITRMIYRATRKRMGRVPKSMTMTAYHTPTLLASAWLDAAGAAARTVPLVLKELAQIKVAAMVGCPF